tara:strand:- start:4123 stop:4443 length:321 start_codon:yes stop_codon:yes gene_type:complete
MASTKHKTIELDPSSTQSKIHKLEYVYGEDLIHIQAIVDDIQQVRPQTYLDPAEYKPALCYTSILWDEDINKDNEPTIEDIDKMVLRLDHSSWKLAEYTLCDGGYC